ncbi:MAG: Glycosyltransferase [Candidatus Shapirobacteria bacterium GW2011_GWE1_38_10]|uniref:Glycosyltransferase n=1 Tax=Candidatus Shapirobacteria bacterium GW2011_GWE1_38_10 TaxID=1618488 RepID=A0A0G0LBJ7_9BACT|nr:MAG: Glycosyltransferase [Candidatus Shapirobacteria bacterium GW2011_GWF2_37_20]KKQ50051.1 MAG: Glycosyltransferase [Candidatus Shapirobacteria bacterium GW2011_GWE1_38_10]KKQ64557.1 MAG: Glycosyltransferase [Candidatus Shapirobacteria bacterium GW2011_GWF1_38_23]
MIKSVFVLILGYKDINNVDECIRSLLKQSYKSYKIWYADNNSNDGSVDYIKKNFPSVKTFQFTDNSGYAGGNNKLIKKAFTDKADFCLVLNADTKVDKYLLNNLVSSYEMNSIKHKVGLVQPAVMLYDLPNKINTIGNVIHYLGYGYCGNYLTEKIPKLDRQIVSASGTAMLISKDYYKAVGLFDEDFFMYNEDQNYSWRGLLKGYKHFLSVKGKIWHKYSFSKNKNKMYHSEKNRLMIIFENYEKLTLWKLMPIIVINEILMIVYSLFTGWFHLKLKSYFYILKNLKTVKKYREAVQSTRIVDDKVVFENFESRLDFKVMNNVLIKLFVNPFYIYYNKFVLM